MPTTSKICKKARKGQFDWPTFLGESAGRVPDFGEMPEEVREASAHGYALLHSSKWAQPDKSRESTLSQ